MSKAKWTPQGLALYWGQKCEYVQLIGNKGKGRPLELMDAVGLVDGVLFSDFSLKGSLVLHLKPLSAMTEEEKANHPNRNHDAYPTHIMAWFFSLGINVGGWIDKGAGPVWASPEELVSLGLVVERGEG